MSIFLRVSDLRRSYDNVDAVKNISFDVEEGEFVALLGPSGCGKSTTLKMIAGLEQPDGGTIEIDGQNVVNKSPGKRNLSMVFQSYALFPHLSVKENIIFGLKARKVPKAERMKRLHSAIEMVDLGPHIDKKPGQLSGGQSQRVALARSIVSNAPLCLMDEPLSNLDTKLRADMRSEIRALQKQLKLTVIYVTHDQIEAMSMADKIILLNEGGIEQAAAPEAFYDRPETSFVASFIGHPPMNLITCDDVQVGVRPEHVSIVDSSGLEVVVQECDYQGSETIVSTIYQGSIIRASFQGKRSIANGTKVTLSWDREAEHHFSSKTGHRVIVDHAVLPFH
ncbi:MAG: sn-glycerol 3-phosphate transport system ATP-binding protein [Granulosicoccus sp.]|jgi:sn-glycerol 3-phosphate transport system ATP-binding protein